MTVSSEDFAKNYADWLSSRLTQQVRDGVVEISTPMLDSHNDGLRVYIDQRLGQTVIHDGGLTYETLSIHGIDLVSDNRRSTVQRILNASGATSSGNRIEISANRDNLPQRMHLLLVAMSRLNDLWMTARIKGSALEFFEDVCKFLDNRNVLYSTNLTVPGRTVEHPIDIVIPLPKRRERLIRLIQTPNPNSAKIISFSWFDIMETRPDSERVVLLNDTIDGDFKNVSAQTEAILMGYSTSIFRWSHRDDQSFKGLWMAA